jgi:hypothetical protein
LSSPTPYRTEILPHARRQIAAWHLSDSVLVEVYLRLCETMPAAPTAHLDPGEDFGNGMVYRFRLVDPENRLREYRFAFQVFYNELREVLYVSRGAYRRTEGI